MKALTLWQPWASLCVIPRPCVASQHGPSSCPADRPFKTIETRSWKAPDTLIGQRIAIHAAKRPPDVDHLGGLDIVQRLPHRGGDPYEWGGTVVRSGDWYLYPVPLGDDKRVHRVDLLPLGAVVGTAVLADCVPMVDALDPDPTGPFVYVDPDFIQVHDGPDDGAPRYLEEERHFGHFESGRWAWLLTDAVRFDEPIPATGRQGIWNWASPCTGDGACLAAEHIDGCFAGGPDG